MSRQKSRSVSPHLSEKYRPLVNRKPLKRCACASAKRFSESNTQVTAALDAAEKAFGGTVNAAVNCAGIGVAEKTVGKNGAHPLVRDVT
jgi:hypothetical protein